MSQLTKNETYAIKIKPYALALALIWSATVIMSLLWNVYQSRQKINDVARIQARDSFTKDVVYRRWNAGHGGVYVPVTNKTLPNPYLKVPERDITTHSGGVLTLINPAYMTRQVHELSAKTYGVQGHITSLNPIRPANAPDQWEILALKSFQNGDEEISSIEEMNGDIFMRLMRPLVTEKGCLKCHAEQGYKIGDIRGGISVYVPMSPLRTIERSHFLALSLGHGLLWLIGLVGIGLGTRRLNRQIIERQKAKEVVKLNEQRLEALLELNQMTEATLEDIAAFAMEEAVRLTQSKIGYIAFVSEDESILTMHAWSKQALRECRTTEKPIIYPVVNTGLWGEAVRQRRPIITNNYQAPNPLKKGMPEGHVEVKRHMNVPIFDGDRIVVVAGVGNKKVDYDDSDVRQLKLLMSGMWRIIQRKRIEESLKESEERFREIVELLPEPVFEMNVNGRLTFMNRSGFELFKYTQQDFEQGKNAFDMIVPEDRQRALENAFKVLKEEKVGLREYTAIRKDGSTFPVMFNSSPIFNEKKFIGLRGVVIDISERKKTEEALRESEERYRLLVQHAPAGIYEFDMETMKFISVNEVMCEYTGYTRDEFLALDPWELIADESKETRDRLIDEVFSGKQNPAPVEYKIRGKNNQEFWVLVHSRFSFENGVPKKATAIVHDLTVIRQAEEEKKQLEDQLHQALKMEAIGTLAGGIAHDFNNILGIILGNTELAIDDIPTWNPARMNLEEIKMASLRAKDVVRQLLSFARKTKLEKKPINITSIVKESFKLLRSSIPTSIDIRQNIPTDIDTILADPTQINQVLINLCTNADHAMPDGGIIEVTLKNVKIDEDTATQYPELNPGRYINLTVGDSGHGISQDQIDRIFDPYFTTKEVGKGTGMGLAVVHGIVKEHNGLITVGSELGKGTTFNIFFPAVEKEAIVETEIDEQLPNGDERILFIDDEESIVKLGHRRLERLGYKVEATTSPIEALELFRSQPDKFDLTMTDLTMPQMTGDKLVKEILNIRPDIPIILCTGFSEKVDEKKAKAIGAADYIEKPLDKHDFAFKVRKVLDRKRE